MNKFFQDIDTAVADIPDGATIAMGGSFSCGAPIELTKALIRRRPRALTIIVQSPGVGCPEVSELIEKGHVAKVIANYPFYRSVEKGRTHALEQMAREGRVELEVYPMGTFTHKLYAGGAGIAGFYTRTGAGTLVAEGKATLDIGGHPCILEFALRPDYALVHAFKGDIRGNLVYRKTARNNNPVMAMSARTTIAEVENMVETGTLDPDQVHTPGIYVRRVVQAGRLGAHCGID
jgi:3-oxoacid CoA-transferase A subunit